MSMRLRLEDLPSYQEFESLFPQYKLKSWMTRITPTHSISRTLVPKIVNGTTVTPDGSSGNVAQPEIPSLEMFILPTRFNTHSDKRDWGKLDGLQIQDILNQSQIKARRMIPSKSFSFNTKNPVIARTGFVPNRTDDVFTATETFLGKAPWLENGPYHGLATNEDQRKVTHYGFDVLCARIDRGSFAAFESFSVGAL